MTRTLWLWLVVASVGCAGRVDKPVTIETESLGDPENGFPNPYERALFMAANRTRSDPATVKGADSKIYPAAPPLALAYDLERSSRFHATMLATGHAPLMHASPCVLAADVGTSNCDGAPSCGCAGGASCNTCDSSACAAGTDPGTRIRKFYASANWGWGEIIAAGYGDPWATMDGWVDEPASSDGHRQIVTSASYGVVGFGHAENASGCWPNFDGGDFAGDKPAVALIASAAPKPHAGPAGSFRLYATWADAQGGAPAALRAVVDGACRDLSRELGDPKLNATYVADVTLADGCHSVYVLGTSATGARASYPTTTAFTIAVGNPTACPDSLPQSLASCDGAAPDMAGGAPLDMAGAPADMAQASGPTVALDAPSDGAQYALGATVTLQASASATATRVVANWSRFGYTSTFPLTQDSPGQWSLSLQVAQRAGTRTISITATDDAGQSATTPSISIDVR
jgi:Big-like domain-containing protein